MHLLCNPILTISAKLASPNVLAIPGIDPLVL